MILLGKLTKRWHYIVVTGGEIKHGLVRTTGTEEHARKMLKKEYPDGGILISLTKLLYLRSGQIMELPEIRMTED